MSKEDILRTASDLLQEGSEEVRYHAVRDLSRVNSMGAIPLLMEAVGDESYRIREEALQGICAFPCEVIFPRLESFLRDHDNANLRTAAMEAFPRYGREAVLYLTRLLKDYDEEVRTFSAVMLGEVADPLSVEGLIEALRDRDENVRHSAAESLGKIRDHRAVKPLMWCLEDDFWVQYPAVIALGDIGDPLAVPSLVRLLEDEMLRQPVIEALGKIGDPSVVPTLAEILSQSDPTVRNDTIAALVRIHSRSHDSPVVEEMQQSQAVKNVMRNGELIEHLLGSLSESEGELRKNAVIALGWFKEKRAVGKLVQLLSDYDLEEYVVGSLASIGKEAVPELVQALEGFDTRVVTAAIRCLEWIGEEEGIKACVPFLKHESEEVRSQALMAVGEMIDREEVVEALTEFLGDGDQEFRLALVEVLGRSSCPGLLNDLLPELQSENSSRKLSAVQILGRLGNARAVRGLADLLADSGDEIRAETFRSLCAIDPKSLTGEMIMQGLSDESPTVRLAAAACLAQGAGENAEDSLLPYLGDTDPQIRLAAVEALGKIGGDRSIQPLVEAFGGGDKRLKIAVLKALGNIRSRETMEFLLGRLREGDADLKRAAIESLTQIKDPRSVPDLIVALDDRDWSVRSAAISALGRIQDRRCVGHLLVRLEDPEDLIKKETIAALREIGAREAVNELMPHIHNENLQLEVVNALEKLGIPDLEFYFDFLKRCNTRIKCLLVDVVGRMRNSRALPYLEKILEDEFFTVRARAAKALGEIGFWSATPALIKAQREDPSLEVQREAALALKRLDAQKT